MPTQSGFHIEICTYSEGGSYEETSFEPIDGAGADCSDSGRVQDEVIVNGGGIYGKGAITLTDATVTGNNRYDVYYDGKESTTPELTVSGSVQAGYYANEAWKLPIFVSGALSEDSVIHVGVYEGIKPGYGKSLAIAEPVSGVTLSAENFKADAAESETSLGEGGGTQALNVKFYVRSNGTLAVDDSYTGDIS